MAAKPKQKFVYFFNRTLLSIEKYQLLAAKPTSSTVDVVSIDSNGKPDGTPFYLMKDMVADTYAGAAAIGVYIATRLLEAKQLEMEKLNYFIRGHSIKP